MRGALLVSTSFVHSASELLKNFYFCALSSICCDRLYSFASPDTDNEIPVQIMARGFWVNGDSTNISSSGVSRQVKGANLRHGVYHFQSITDGICQGLRKWHNYP